MNTLLKLNALLRLYEANFLNLHWNTEGENFNDAHKSITTDYYELCGKYIDETAEMICRLGGNPFSYMEVAYTAKHGGFYVVDTKKLYTREEIIHIADGMLGDICKALCDCLDDPEIKDNTMNAGMKSQLESILDAFDIEYRYINKRRQM